MVRNNIFLLITSYQTRYLNLVLVSRIILTYCFTFNQLPLFFKSFCVLFEILHWLRHSPMIASFSYDCAIFLHLSFVCLFALWSCHLFSSLSIIFLIHKTMWLLSAHTFCPLSVQGQGSGRDHLERYGSKL